MSVEIKSPLSGTIKQVLVKEGDVVNSGDAVVVLESMKMEIPIESTAAGTVNQIAVAPGDFTNQGDTLVEVNTG